VKSLFAEGSIPAPREPQSPIARLEDEKGFQTLAQSKKKGAAAENELAEGWAVQNAIRQLVCGLPNTVFKDREAFENVLDTAAKQAGLRLAAPARKAILAALSERDETAAICRDKDGNSESDPESKACRSPRASIPSSSER
jgi:type I restriction enzyme M protein